VAVCGLISIAGRTRTAVAGLAGLARRGGRPFLRLAELDVPEHVHEDAGVVRGQRAPRFAHHVRLGHALVGADLLQRVDDVGGVLVERVVERGDELVGVRAHVVDAQAAAAIEVLEREAHLPQLGVDARTLVDHVLDGADVGELAADVEVEELDLALHLARAQELHSLDQLRRGQPELGEVARGGLPLAGPLGGELAAQPDQGLHVHLLRQPEQVRQLGELLDHHDDLTAQLAPEQRQSQIFLVLVAVADGEGLGVGVEGEHDEQLALAARLQPHVVRRAGVEDLLDHFAHLVHLGRVDAEVLPLEAVLRDGGAERLVELLHPGAQHVLEAHHAGEAELALADVIDHVHQIDLRARLPVRVHDQVALVVDGEVAGAPARDVVELERFFDRPI
jgi:hypothetical protein